jgi:hypothetical protein
MTHHRPHAVKARQRNFLSDPAASAKGSPGLASTRLRRAASRVIVCWAAALAGCGGSLGDDNPSDGEALTGAAIATLQAASMTTKTVGATCGGSCWELKSNGYIESTVTFPSAATYQFDISAYGSYAGGAWPNMELRIDQVKVASVSVNSATLKTFSLQANVAAGAHRVAVAFTNDYYAAGVGDRNLFVTQIVISPLLTKIATLQPASMTHTTGGSCGGSCWEIWSNGYVESSVNFPTSGPYELDVSAYGSYAGGAWPNMELRIDQVKVASATVDSASVKIFRMKANVNAGAHRVAVAFTNDYYSAGAGDRNLFVTQIVIYGTASSTVPPAPDMGTPPPAHSVALSFTPSVTAGVKYNIYRGTASGGPYTSIATGLTAASVTDTAVAAGKTYYYVATAVSSSNVESAHSNQAAAVVPSP